MLFLYVSISRSMSSCVRGPLSVMQARVDLAGLKAFLVGEPIYAFHSGLELR